MPRPDVGRTIDRPEATRGDARLDPEPAIEDLADQAVVAFDDGTLDVGLVHGHAHESFWQGWLLPTSHRCGYPLSRSDRTADPDLHVPAPLGNKAQVVPRRHSAAVVCRAAALTPAIRPPGSLGRRSAASRREVPGRWRCKIPGPGFWACPSCPTGPGAHQNSVTSLWRGRVDRAADVWYIAWAVRSHSQVVRQWSAKPPFPSSNLGGSSIFSQRG